MKLKWIFGILVTLTVLALSKFSFAAYNKEAKFGFYADKSVVASQILLLDESLNQRIAEIGNQVVKVSDRPNMQYTFRVINDPMINAYSAAGGFVYVNTGLLDVLESEDELAAVIAHEIGHISKNHQINFVCTQQRVQMAGNILSNVLGAASAAAGPIATQAFVPATSVFFRAAAEQTTNLLANLGNMICGEMATAMIKGYGKDQELKADVLAIQYVKKAGYDPNALISVFKRLAAVRDKLKINEQNYVSNLINAEPGLEARIKEAENSLTKIK